MAAERKELELAYMAKIKSGEVEVRKRKRRMQEQGRSQSKLVQKLMIVILPMTAMTTPTMKNASLKARRSSRTAILSSTLSIKDPLCEYLPKIGNLTRI